MKALVGAFNQEKALVEAFSVIVKTDCETEGSCSLSARYKITPRICEMSSEENSILTVPTTDGIAPRSMEICRELRGTVSCAAVSNKTAAFYCFMFPEAKKQQDLIKLTPACSWRMLEYFLHSYWTSSIDREGCATS